MKDKYKYNCGKYLSISFIVGEGKIEIISIIEKATLRLIDWYKNKAP